MFGRNKKKVEAVEAVETPETVDAVIGVGDEPEHVVTTEDLKMNPAMEEAGVKPGDVIGLGEEVDITSIDVFSASGVYIRTYSVGVHGDSFMALAAEFAKKISGKLK